MKSYEELTIPRRCPECGAILRPDVVLFGEQLPVDVVEKFYAELDAGFDTVFSVGTTSSSCIWLPRNELGVWPRPPNAFGRRKELNLTHF
ncbi:MAG: Sir2 family NAD-dependent protein deacetylase [Thermoguttaceae bacterium]